MLECAFPVSKSLHFLQSQIVIIKRFIIRFSLEDEVYTKVISVEKIYWRN